MKLSQRVLSLAESATIAVTAKAKALKASGADIVGFAAGEPDFDTPENIKQVGIAAIRNGQTKYPSPASGLPAAREAVCTKLARDNHIQYKPEQVVITSGGKMGIYLAMQAILDPGDEVIVAVPYWVSFPEIARLAGGVPVFVKGEAANAYKLTPGELSAALTDRTTMVILNWPSNPSGVVYSKNEVSALAEVLADRDLVVMSDETYDQLMFNGQTMHSYAAASEAAYQQTITINSASKSFAMPGWRVAYAAGPVKIIKAMGKLITQTTSGAATFTQLALVEALAGDQARVKLMRDEFEERSRHMWERINSLPGVTCSRPDGAMYCFPDVSGTYEKLGVSGSAEFATRMLEEVQVAVVPGIAFGLDDHVRLTFAVSLDQIDKGLDRIAKFLA